jgi:hypothetical protein
MTIVGFNFTKINVEKKEAKSPKVNISNNVGVKDVKETNLSLGTEKQKAIKFIFEFATSYEPDIGGLTFVGEVLYLEAEEKTKAILDQWKKDKSVDKDLMSAILNTVLSKCNVQALILSQEVNLPSPIPLPKVKVDTEKKEKSE